MTTTAMTDDTNARLSVLEAEVRNINARLDETNTRLDETNANLRQLSDRIDRTNARIDRLFYAIIGIGAGIIITLVGGFVGLIIQSS